MRKLWEMLSPFVVVLVVLWLAGCEHGRWNETGMMIEGEKAKQPAHWLVSRVQDNYRVWIQQPQIVTYSHCSAKRTSEEMARLRFPAVYRAGGYTDPIEFEGADTDGFVSQYRQCKEVITAQVTNGQSIFSQVGGPAAIGIGAWLIADGLRDSADRHNTTNNNNTSANGGAGGSINQNNGNTSTRSITQNNVNNIRVK